MKVHSCSNCGANVTVDNENREYVFCQYCGTKIMLDDYRSTQRIVDEAKIKQAETERIIRLKELELEEQKQRQRSNLKKLLTYIWLGLIFIVAIICIIIWILSDMGGMDAILVLFYVGGPIVVGGAYLLFKVMPEKENENGIIKSGGVKFPKSLEPFNEQNYITVQTTLQKVGFYNVSCVNMHDLTLGLLQKPGKVESISVNGEIILSGGKVYLPDAVIVITYHGK